MIEVFLFGIILGIIPITLAGLFVTHIYNTVGISPFIGPRFISVN